LMLTMYDTELTLIHMLKAGVNGFLKKDVHPEQLHHAIKVVVSSRYYYNNTVTKNMVNKYLNEENDWVIKQSFLSEMEITFLKLCCSDLSYKEIAAELDLHPRAVERLRENLFYKLEVKSRVGLAMIALRHGLVHI
jgi:two-component system invasion response regulator UvrY